MRLLNRTMMTAFLGIGLTLDGAASLSAAGSGGYQYYRGYRDPGMSYNLRGLIDRTQNDLRAAEELGRAKEDQRRR